MLVYLVEAGLPEGWAASTTGFQLSPPSFDSKTAFCIPIAKPCFSSRNHTREINPPSTWLIFLSGLICAAIRFQFRPDSCVNHNDSSVTIHPVESFRKKMERGCSVNACAAQ